MSLPLLYTRKTVLRVFLLEKNVLLRILKSKKIIIIIIIIIIITSTFDG